MKKGYYVSGDPDDEYGIAVVATSSKEAKKIGFPFLDNEYDADYIDVRVKWKRDANIDKFPIGIIEDYLTGLKCGIYDYIYGVCENCRGQTFVELHDGVVLCKFCHDKQVEA